MSFKFFGFKLTRISQECLTFCGNLNETTIEREEYCSSML